MNTEQVIEFCKKYNITNYHYDDINNVLNVNGNVDLHSVFNDNIIELPIQFGKVTGSFNCSFNSLTTLKGVPNYVGRNFNVYNNELTSLEYSPDIVIGNFMAYYNNLTTLKGIPKYVGGDISLHHNKLIEIDYLPEYAIGYLSISSNNLSSLKNINDKFERYFISDNPNLFNFNNFDKLTYRRIESLRNTPYEIIDYFGFAYYGVVDETILDFIESDIIRPNETKTKDTIKCSIVEELFNDFMLSNKMCLYNKEEILYKYELI